MANTIYPKGKEGFALGEIAWVAANFKAVLVRGYTYSTGHKFLSDAVSAGAVIGATATLSSRSAPDGVLNAGVFDFGNVTTGSPLTAILVYQASAVTGGADVATSAQRLTHYIDTVTGGLLPVTPNGGQITFTPDAGPNKLSVL